MIRNIKNSKSCGLANIDSCIFVQIVSYMDGNNYFHPNHHCFRSGHSTATALLQMCDSWLENVDKQQLVGECLIDLSAAFDVFDNELLVAKLVLYIFTPKTVSDTT